MLLGFCISPLLPHDRSAQLVHTSICSGRPTFVVKILGMHCSRRRNLSCTSASRFLSYCWTLAGELMGHGFVGGPHLLLIVVVFLVTWLRVDRAQHLPDFILGNPRMLPPASQSGAGMDGTAERQEAVSGHTDICLASSQDMPFF